MCIVRIFLFWLDRKTFLFLDFFWPQNPRNGFEHLANRLLSVCVQSILCAGFQWIWPKKSRHSTRLINLASQEECSLNSISFISHVRLGNSSKKAFWKRVVFQKENGHISFRQSNQGAKATSHFSPSLWTRRHNEIRQKENIPRKYWGIFCWWLIDGTLEVGTAENFDVNGTDHHRREATRRM